MEEKIRQLEQKIEELESRLTHVQESLPQDQLSMVVFSGDLDKMLASFIIATGAAAMYERVVMFLTFWGTTAMRDPGKDIQKSDFMAKMFGMMLPKGAGKLQLSKMNMAGLGTSMIKGLMKKKGVMSLEQLMKTAADFGVEIVICEMSMDLMGLKMEEFIDYPNISVGGVAKFLQEAGQSRVSLFI
ncbi:DsrE2-like domain-containing protein [Desulfonema limicola]|uniref:DsrE2-like domain-containing protein n=1 Tax=Desulfonema limicola TaxID=45656 RepID=A0A975BBZ3_9BACT|nr:DsrE/DsrF/DrsH-like family protein [Desulfonema limicola]QTA82568.1 DsrE2-like domain-containing protein [Desulfonema limicola]